MNAVIYVRFSSRSQREQSIEPVEIDNIMLDEIHDFSLSILKSLTYKGICAAALTDKAVKVTLDEQSYH